MSLAVVTGSAGFVGGHLVTRLAAAGRAVRAVDLRPGPVDAPNVEGLEVDLTDAGAAERIVAGADTVFHVASLVHTRRSDAERVWAVNHGGTVSLLAAAPAPGGRRFVHVSSASVVYEGRDIENGDESLPYASSSQAPYADSKIAAERAVLEADDSGFSTCAVRPHVVFGPGDQRFMPAILDRAAAGRLTTGVGSADKLSDFTYIDNLIDALTATERALDAGTATGQAYFVTNGEPTPFWGFVDLVLEGLGRPPIARRVPYAAAYAAATLRELWESLRGLPPGVEGGLTRFAVRYLCTHHWFSIDKARRDLAWEPAVGIEEGIRRTLAARGG